MKFIFTNILRQRLKSLPYIVKNYITTLPFQCKYNPKFALLEKQITAQLNSQQT